MKQWIFLLCLLCAANPATAEMGRLFFTPAERANLDVLRANAKSVEIIDATTGIETPIEIAPPSDVSVQGYVTRGDGKKSTVWVNGQPVQENSSGAGVEVGKIQSGSNQIPLMLPGSGRSIQLKAGQIYDPVNDQVSDIKASKNPSREGEAELPVPPSDKLPPEVLEKIRELKRN
jgi:hypothetical protein